MIMVLSNFDGLNTDSDRYQINSRIKSDIKSNKPEMFHG